MLDDAPSTRVQAALREASAAWRQYCEHELSVDDPDGLELARLGERAERAEAGVLLYSIANDADAIAIVAYFRRVVATEGRQCRDAAWVMFDLATDYLCGIDRDRLHFDSREWRSE